MAVHNYSIICFLGLAAVGVSAGRVGPTAVDPLQKDGRFVSFTHGDHPGNRVGYRFHEHHPYVYGTAPTEADEDQVAKAEAAEAVFAKRPGVFVNRVAVREDGWAPQDWAYYIAPAEDGFDLLWVIETQGTGLNEFYAVQQCFRMSGRTNQEWRRRIAETPAFSEFDQWAKEEEAVQALTSLSHVHSEGAWQRIPATRDNVGYRTPLGVKMDLLRTGGDLAAAELAPYNPTVSAQVLDTGLAARTDRAAEWVCALYWEGTTHVTDHHPADCLHAVVNLGPIPPQSKRAIRGKIYWTKMSLDTLFDTWRRAFAR